MGIRTSHLDDGRGNTLCGYSWEPWQDSSTRIDRVVIGQETNHKVRLELIRELERQVAEDQCAIIRFCPACLKLVTKERP